MTHLPLDAGFGEVVWRVPREQAHPGMQKLSVSSRAILKEMAMVELCVYMGQWLMHLNGQGSHMSFLFLPIGAGRWLRRMSCSTLATKQRWSPEGQD